MIRGDHEVGGRVKAKQQDSWGTAFLHARTKNQYVGHCQSCSKVGQSTAQRYRSPDSERFLRKRFTFAQSAESLGLECQAHGVKDSRPTYSKS